MARLSKVDAAKAAGVSRQTLYAYLKSGRLSADADGLIDTAELLRAGFTLHEIGRPPSDTSGQPLTSSLDTLDVYRDMIDMLTRQLADAQAREQAAQERERDYREHIARLTAMLDQAHQQNQRLLAPPRQALPRPPRPTRTPVERPAAPAGDPRGTQSPPGQPPQRFWPWYTLASSSQRVWR
jgi:DNA-binding transcriptional MerR regulator